MDLAALYKEWASRLLGYTMSITRDRHLAEDALQNLFVKLATSGVDVKNHAVYLFRAARNEALSLSKRKGPQPLPLADILAPEESTGSQVDAAELTSALDRLPEEQSEVVILHIVEGLPFKEIAEITGCSLDTAASRYRYALEKLKEFLRPWT
jgi:RNA polymerase sigma-70 factor, ECF subfamily